MFHIIDHIKESRVTTLNQALLSLHKESLKITLTVPLIGRINLFSAKILLLSLMLY